MGEIFLLNGGGNINDIATTKDIILETTDTDTLASATGVKDIYNSLNDSKISSDKILSNSAFNGTVSDRGYLADAKDVKDEFTSLNTNLTIKTVDVTNGKIFYVPAFKLVLFRFRTIANKDLSIGTIPSGYRPSDFAYMAGVSFSDDANTKYPADVLVSSDGTITVLTNGVGRVRGCGWWITS